MSIKQSYIPLQGKYSQGNHEDKRMNSFMMADNHTSLHIRIKTADVCGEAELTALRTVQKVINLVQLTQKSNGREKWFGQETWSFLLSFFDVSLTMMGSSFIGHYMRYLHKCKTTNTYTTHMNLHKKCMSYIVYNTHRIFFHSIDLLSNDSFWIPKLLMTRCKSLIEKRRKNFTILKLPREVLDAPVPDVFKAKLYGALRDLS